MNKLLKDLYHKNDKLMSDNNVSKLIIDDPRSLLPVAVQMLENINHVIKMHNLLSPDDQSELEEYNNEVQKFIDLIRGKETAGVFEQADPSKGDRIIVNVGTSSAPKYMLGVVMKVSQEDNNRRVHYSLDDGTRGDITVNNTGAGIVGFTRCCRLLTSSIPAKELSLYIDRTRWVADALKSAVINPVEQPIQQETPTYGSEKINLNDLVGKSNYEQVGLPWNPLPSNKDKLVLYRALSKITGGALVEKPGHMSYLQNGTKKDNRTVSINPMTNRHWDLEATVGGVDQDVITCALSDIKVVINFLKGI